MTGTEWQTVKIPFSEALTSKSDSHFHPNPNPNPFLEFSYDWSDFTGRCDTKDHPKLSFTLYTHPSVKR